MPRDKLTRDQIVRTALELLDEEGLEGLNMRSLGKRLDSAATAVYWHVKSKDNLVLLVADRLWDEVALPDLDTVGWRTAAGAMAADLHAMFVRHPWLVQALASHLLYGPGKARHDDHSLAVYEAAGLEGTAADQAAAAVFMYVLGSASGASAQAALRRRFAQEGTDGDALLAETVAQAAEIAMQFPHLRSRIEAASGTDYAAAPDRSFEFGLRALLDGIEADLAAARA
ncbi:TetR/AcrR family transcriptional regulator C-terminal domain-containing protein [Yinghuangia soli]|uniref:TetR/AcrR family transcriptional regulator C-terminal domain-containing protein n=1 Tax=Yinghuangia soli TaxID=2908204 RepID=A0AA41Q0X8_9ACTN|nr:TetR/AcrR family transcriptional regulator C-terminal domain-containing protein [Yinghuangia soli]MCF2529286.1 TetR/AcrR family transcriptional regulator C-terminal domain-containing protein [Yinghuangia soli]